LHNNTYQGITLGKGVHTLSPGVVFTGKLIPIVTIDRAIDIQARTTSVSIFQAIFGK